MSGGILGSVAFCCARNVLVAGCETVAPTNYSYYTQTGHEAERLCCEWPDMRGVLGAGGSSGSLGSRLTPSPFSRQKDCYPLLSGTSVVHRIMYGVSTVYWLSTRERLCTMANVPLWVSTHSQSGSWDLFQLPSRVVPLDRRRALVLLAKSSSVCFFSLTAVGNHDQFP